MMSDRLRAVRRRSSILNRFGVAMAYLSRRGRALIGRRGRTAVKFLAVGASGVAVNIAVMAAVMVPGVNYLPAGVVGTEMSILWNFYLYERFVFHDRRGSGQLRTRMLKTFVYNNLEFALRVPFLVFAVAWGVNGLLAQFGLLVVAFVARYAFTSRIVYKLRPDTPVIAPVARVNVGGPVSVTS